MDKKQIKLDGSTVKVINTAYYKLKKRRGNPFSLFSWILISKRLPFFHKPVYDFLQIKDAFIFLVFFI